MTPHPFKTDTWVEGDRLHQANLCNEIPQPTNTVDAECILGKPDLSKLTGNHLTQIQAELWRRGGGPEGKIIQAFFSGATPKELLSKEQVDEYVDQLIWFFGDAKKGNAHLEEVIKERWQSVADTVFQFYEEKKL